MTSTKINMADLSTEAAIYAEGTQYSKEDLVRLYREHVAECDAAGTEPKYCQRFFSEDLKIAN